MYEEMERDNNTPTLMDGRASVRQKFCRILQ